MLHVITGLGVGGAEAMLTALVAELEARGIEQHVVALKSGGRYVEPLRALIGARLVELGIDRPRQAPGGTLRLADQMRRVEPDLVQSWMYHGDLAATLAYWLAGFGSTRVPLYWGIRCSELDLTRYSPALRRVIRACRRLSRKPTGILVNSRAGLDSHRRFGFPGETMHLVPNCVDTERFRPDPATREAARAALGIAPDAFVFGIVARCDPMKGYDVFTELAARLPEATALAVGRDTETLSGPPNLRALGERADVPELLQAMDVLVSPSRFGEGTSNSILEAMAAGRPVVATDVGDAADLLGAAAAGDCIVAPGDAAGMAARLSALRDDPARAAALGDANRRRALDAFSRAAMADRFLAVYRGEV